MLNKQLGFWKPKTDSNPDVLAPDTTHKSEAHQSPLNILIWNQIHQKNLLKSNTIPEESMCLVGKWTKVDEYVVLAI